MTTPIRFGILSTANIARKLSRAIILAPNATIHAIGSRSVDKARKYAESNGYPAEAKIYGSYEEVLDDPEFMDGTQWMHRPRTVKMKEFLGDSKLFGQLKFAHSNFTFSGGQEFLQNDIRVNPDLEPQGALGDQGWYCVRAILWAADYQPPKTVIALHGAITNDAGVILACGANLLWEDGKSATLYCSFLSNVTMDIIAIGTKGSMHVNDFVLPRQEGVASFSAATETEFTDLMRAWASMPIEHNVKADLPQEVLMIEEFSTLVARIKQKGSKPDQLWPSVSRKTQLILDAIKDSFAKGCVPVDVFTI
ncbi:hypothetical protein Ancab_038625 [Ancistrocladus abbreviatus]